MKITTAQAELLLQNLPAIIQLGEEVALIVKDLLVSSAPDNWAALHAELLTDEAILSARTPPVG